MKVIIAVILLFCLHAQPMEDEVTGAVVANYSGIWYSGTHHLLQVISLSTKKTKLLITTSSSNPRKIPPTTLSCSGSMVALVVLA